MRMWASWTLAAGEPFFKVEIEADDSEDHGDGPGRLVDMLSAPCVGTVLVEEGGIGMGEGVEGKLVEERLIGTLLLGGHRICLKPSNQSGAGAFTSDRW